MREPEQADLEALLRALIAAGVEYIVVGGTAAVLHGAPITTLDLDIVPSLAPSNVDRLEALLADLRASLRDPAGRDIAPTRAHLEAGGQIQLRTRLGPLDILGRLHDGRSYDELLGHTVEVRDGELAATVLDLKTLIEVKRSTGRARDRLQLPVLIALLDEGGAES